MHVNTPLIIVDVDRTQALPADQLALAMGLGGAQVIAGFEQALALFEQRRPANACIVVDIGMHGEELLPELQRLFTFCEAGTRIVAVGSINDLRFYRSLKAMGVIEYFTHPVNVVDIRQAFAQAALQTRGMGPGEQRGSITAFISAASGDGASTVAMNVAYGMAREQASAAVLVDMDYQFGMIARHLDLHAQFGIRELFDHPDRGVDATLVSKMLFAYGEHLKIIAAPEPLHMLPQVKPEIIRELLTLLRGHFGQVIVDVPHLWTPWTAEVLAQADRIVVVTQLWLRSLAHLSRMLVAWQQAGISADKVVLVSNRSGAKYREAITPQDVERVCQKPVHFYLANDIKTVVSAENHGKTILEMGNSLLERQLRELAGTLNTQDGGIFVPPPVAGVAGRKSFLGTLREKAGG
jgi:pilus assembly protein CpaE